MISLSAIREAASRIAGKVHRTLLLSSRSIGERAGVRLFLECESLQRTGSFKVPARGRLAARREGGGIQSFGAVPVAWSGAVRSASAAP